MRAEKYGTLVKLFKMTTQIKQENNDSQSRIATIKVTDSK